MRGERAPFPPMSDLPDRGVSAAAAGTMTADAGEASAFSTQCSSTANVSEPGAASSTDATRSIASVASPRTVAPANVAKSLKRRGAVMRRLFRRRRDRRDVQRFLDVGGDVVAAVRRPFASDDKFVMALFGNVDDGAAHLVRDFVLPLLLLALERREGFALLVRTGLGRDDRLIVCAQLVVVVDEFWPALLELGDAHDGDPRMRLSAAA